MLLNDYGFNDIIGIIRGSVGEKPMNIAIIEDNDREAAVLSDYLNRYGSEKNLKLSVTRFKSAETFLKEYRKATYSIIFMDIDLPGINGMDAARELRRTDDVVTLIFVTKMAQYAYKGYEYSALDFLVKPIKYSDFCLKLKRAVDVAQTNEVREVFVPLNNGFCRITSDKIIYVEVMGHQLNYQLTDGNIQCRGSLTEVEDKLKGLGFLRCNSCYLINAKFVNSVRGNDIDVAGHILKISHTRRKAFISSLMEIIGGGGISK